MAAAMWRQMLEQAIADVKDEKFQQALDGARRVSQFDANNFQALMCVGLAASHLQEVRRRESRRGRKETDSLRFAAVGRVRVGVSESGSAQAGSTGALEGTQ